MIRTSSPREHGHGSDLGAVTPNGSARPGETGSRTLAGALVIPAVLVWVAATATAPVVATLVATGAVVFGTLRSVGDSPSPDDGADSDAAETADGILAAD